MSDETEMGRIREAALAIVQHCYLPCDQTVQCGDCGVVWWSQPEDLDENWHAEGCGLFAAEVLLGRSKDVRKGPVPEARSPWASPSNEATARAIRERLQRFIPVTCHHCDAVLGDEAPFYATQHVCDPAKRKNCMCPVCCPWKYGVETPETVRAERDRLRAENAELRASLARWTRST